MKLSESLWKANLIYDESQGHTPNQIFYENARKALSKSCISGLKIIEIRTHYTKIDLEKHLTYSQIK